MALADMAMGVNSALKQQMLQRLQAEAVQRQMEQQKFANQMQEKQFASNEELKRAQLAEQADTHKAAEQDRQMGIANTLADQIPAGAAMQSTDPAVKLMQQGGRGSLLTMQGMKAEAPPSSLLAMGDSGQSQEVAGTMPNSPMPNGPRLYTKGASAKQQDTEADNTRQAAKDAQGREHELAMERIAQQAANKQPKEPNPQPQIMVGPDGKQHAVQFVNGQAREIQLPDGYRKTNGTLDNRLASAQTVNQTGNDMLAELEDPQFAATLGPALGRVSSVRDFIGNPPPEFAQLAGQIESYALANMGVHGMRSAQGAEQIKHLLDQKHTPASLAAAIRGLGSFSQHFMDNNGGGSSAPTSAPAASGGAPKAPAGWKYVAKPGGGWTAVEDK